MQLSVSNKLFLRMLVGGIVGGVLFYLAAWGYVILINKAPAVMNPIAAIGSLFVAWLGFVVGAILSVFSWKKPTKQNEESSS